MEENIQEIQELYIDEKMQDKSKGRIEEEEVILIKPYKISESIKTKSSSFVDEEIENLMKYMKFVKTPTQTRIFQPSPYYQSLQSQGEQDLKFWKEMVTALVNNKNNTDTAQNRYPIKMYQGGPPYEPFFIAIDN